MSSSARKVEKHELRRQAKHSVPGSLEPPIAPLVQRSTALVATTFDLDHEPHGGRGEVSDVAGDDDLPPKRDAQTAALKLAPPGEHRCCDAVSPIRAQRARARARIWGRPAARGPQRGRAPTSGGSR